MSRVFLMRLGFDLVAAALLLFCLSYWWLGNVTHEVAGTALFLRSSCSSCTMSSIAAGMPMRRPKDDSGAGSST